MGVGHAAVGLYATRVLPRTNAGVLIFAAFLADFLLGMFALLGLEQAYVPADFASRHYLTFTFPYSHGLVSLIAWGIILGALLSWKEVNNRQRVFLVIAGLVVSHFLLDGLVHARELPLLGDTSPRIGLSLWNYMPFELTLETVMIAAGVLIYFRLEGASSPLGRWGMAAYAVLLTALTWTQLWLTKPPRTSELIPSWLAGPLLFSIIPYALDRRRAAILRG